MASRIDASLRNIRYATRVLLRAPGFTLTVVLTLALGIGANSAVFSAVDAILLRGLPFPSTDRLVAINQMQERSSQTNVAVVRLGDWNRLSSTFAAITGYGAEDVSDITDDLPEKIRRAFVAPHFFDVLGIAPKVGHGFTETEHKQGGWSTVVISDRYWRSRFGADPNVLGKTVKFDDWSPSIIGVMPASFAFPDRDVDWWFPIHTDHPNSRLRTANTLTALGRLKPGVTIEQARADLATVQAQLAQEYPDTDREIGVSMVPLKETIVGDVRGSLWLMFGAVSVLLLIACTNIASLLLARATQREQEIGIRLSLGGSRLAVAAPLLFEAAVLVVVGTIAGLGVAAAAPAAFRTLAPGLPRLDELSFNPGIALYGVGCAAFVALACGLFPAVRSVRAATASARAGRAQVSARHTMQWVLVGVQVALSVTLLAGAGLLVRSVVALSRVDAGFDAQAVLTFRVAGSWAEMRDPNRLFQRVTRTLEEVRALPGIEAAATAWKLPGLRTQNQTEFKFVEGSSDPDHPLVGEWRSVSDGYFQTMSIPLVEGELCRDAPGSGPDVERNLMVNRGFVDLYLPGRSAVGLHLTWPGVRRPARILGIVGDAREIGLDRAPVPAVYTCEAAPNPFPWFLVRTRGDPMSVASAIRVKSHELEPLRSVNDLAPLTQQIDDSFAENRLRTVLLVLFAGSALALACLGVYGTLSYVVSLRHREIGLRVALGARERSIVLYFLGKVLRVAGLACLAGLVLSFSFGRLLSGMLYGVSPTDVVSLSSSAAVVLVVAAVAAIRPSMRAASVEPMRALRDE